MSFTFTQLFQNVEKTASLLGKDLEESFQFLAHLAVIATPTATALAQVVEVATGNAELTGITGVVGTTVTSVAKEVQSSDKVIQNASTIAVAVEKASGNTQDVGITAVTQAVTQAVNNITPDLSSTGNTHVQG